MDKKTYKIVRDIKKSKCHLVIIETDENRSISIKGTQKQITEMLKRLTLSITEQLLEQAKKELN